MRILFIKLRHIGDSLLLTPTIVATKKKYPHAEIWVLVRESCDAILAGCPEIDRILVTANPDATKRTKSGWLSDLRLAALLRRTKFDHVFELTDNDRARFFALAARTPNRCANQHRNLKKIWRPAFHRICEISRRRKHQVLRDFIMPAEILELPLTPGPLRFTETCCVPWHGNDYDSELPFAVLHIHTRWDYKSWPMGRWEALIPRLLGFIPRLLISCGPDPREIEFARALCEKFVPRVQTTAGTASWPQLAWLLRRAAFFVGVDTAAMHLAAACQCPTIALFGPSPVFEYHPWQVKHWMVRPQDWLGEAEAKALPRDELMREIPLERVLAACEEAWKSTSETATANSPESGPA